MCKNLLSAFLLMPILIASLSNAEEEHHHDCAYHLYKDHLKKDGWPAELEELRAFNKRLKNYEVVPGQGFWEEHDKPFKKLTQRAKSRALALFNGGIRMLHMQNAVKARKDTFERQANLSLWGMGWKSKVAAFFRSRNLHQEKKPTFLVKDQSLHTVMLAIESKALKEISDKKRNAAQAEVEEWLEDYRTYRAQLQEILDLQFTLRLRNILYSTIRKIHFTEEDFTLHFKVPRVQDGQVFDECQAISFAADDNLFYLRNSESCASDSDINSLFRQYRKRYGIERGEVAIRFLGMYLPLWRSGGTLSKRIYSQHFQKMRLELFLWELDDLIQNGHSPSEEVSKLAEEVRAALADPQNEPSQMWAKKASSKLMWSEISSFFWTSVNNPIDELFNELSDEEKMDVGIFVPKKITGPLRAMLSVFLLGSMGTVASRYIDFSGFSDYFSRPAEIAAEKTDNRYRDAMSRFVTELRPDQFSVAMKGGLPFDEEKELRWVLNQLDRVGPYRQNVLKERAAQAAVEDRVQVLMSYYEQAEALANMSLKAENPTKLWSEFYGFLDQELDVQATEEQEQSFYRLLNATSEAQFTLLWTQEMNAWEAGEGRPLVEFLCNFRRAQKSSAKAGLDFRTLAEEMAKGFAVKSVLGQN